MEHLKTFLKGLAMGSADVVPGVSGGTIAFITGIYARLLDAISSVNVEAVRVWRRDGFRAVWEHIDGTFLIALGAGILTAIISLAKIIHYLLAEHPVLLWSFFFGLIIASSIHIARTIPQWRWQECGLLLAGVVVAAGISLASPTETTATLPILFLAGSIAICAMILPGISGSFILLLMGLYAPVIGAVKAFDLPILLTVAAGAGLGLLLFSRLLSWLLRQYASMMLALLTGFMIGSLAKVWPWKETISTRINSKGEEVPFVQQMSLPSVDDTLLLSVALMFCGAILVLALERFGRADSE
jgi:putative membrane protein